MRISFYHKSMITKFVQNFLPALYAGYAYAYPHKTAYRALAPAITLRDAWATERRNSLFLYLHVPFCEMRCGFCNLFTTVNAKDGFIRDYLDAVKRQATHVREALGEATFTRMAIGGGTPTYLETTDLHQLFDIAEKIFGVDLKLTPISVETSPLTAEIDKLRLLHEIGVNRISIGVQSFKEEEVNAVGRSQKTSIVEQALWNIREFEFATLNLDLIYGLPGQTVASWVSSLHAALRFAPEEIYLYPLYIRPLTGLGRREMSANDDLRLACYREGRRILLEAGYTQVSMRMFQKQNVTEQNSTAYCCQNDGMVGLGCGARSYTQELHYSNEYAVGAGGIREILIDYTSRPELAFDLIDYGFFLDIEEQRRRFIIQSLLQVEGLNFTSYRTRFGTEALIDLPELDRLMENGLAFQRADSLQLTEAGLEMSDAIGPWLYSGRVRALMSSYELR
jgi:oxygen-independent coproporphyrinogen III oxidase